MQRLIEVDPRRPFPRNFVPQHADMGDWSQVEPLFQQLLTRNPASVPDLEQWLLDWSELASVLDEEKSKRYVAMTTQTDDPVREAAYQEFVEQVEPKTKPQWFALQQAYLHNPYRKLLPMAIYSVMDRIIENDAMLFRQENVPLETEEALLAKEYQKVTGLMTIEYKGAELTLQQAQKYLEEPDRQVRQQVWELTAARRLQDKGTLDRFYDRMVSLRTQIARNASFADFRAYIFRKYRRFDYTPEHCFQYHEGVERAVLPLVRRLHEERRRKLGVQTLRPWDLLVDPLNRPPLRPFTTVDELLAGIEEIFGQVDPALGGQFRFMRDEHLLDLESRKGKAPGGYQEILHERRWPFIFGNAVGRDDDLRLLLHEGGHAFHTLAARDLPLIFYRVAPIEFSEVASMGMELLAAPHLDVFYKNPDEFKRSYRATLQDAVFTLAWVATIDAFQHWVYTHPDHTPDQRVAAWRQTYERFAGLVDWTGYEEARDHQWQRQLHLYEVPFYYIEYGIAQVGALQIWLQSRTNHRAATERYWRALALGGSRPLPALFAAAGASFRFDYETLAPLMEPVGEELARLD